MKLETIVIHGGYQPDPATKAVAVPIYQTTSYAFDNTQHGADLFDLKVEGNIYTRIMNPTTAVLEQRIAAMEGGVGALCLASGMAAINYSVLTLARAGDILFPKPRCMAALIIFSLIPSRRLVSRSALPTQRTLKAWPV